MAELVERADLGDGIVRLTLNRAPVNALSAAFLDRFGERLAELAGDTDVRAVILSSHFSVFSAGLDLKEAQAFDRAGEIEIVRALNDDFLALYSFPKPVIAAVNGAAIAGGLFFVLGADWRVAAPKAQLGLAEVRVGADFPVGPLEIARDALDPNTLRRLMLTGQPVRAEAALAQGFVDAVSDDPQTSALAKAREMAAIPPMTFASVKRQIRGPAIARIEAALKTPVTGWFSAETRPAMQAMIGRP